MATYAWFNDSGELIVDGSGQPIICATCPCCNNVYAIYQRQLAYGITTAWDAGDPTNTAKLIHREGGDGYYTLAQLKAYVNAIATSFIDGAYSGGASQPTMLTGTYADPAGDTDDLYALVIDMDETKETITRANGVTGYGGVLFGYVSWPNAVAFADSDFHTSWSAHISVPARAWGLGVRTSDYGCVKQVISWAGTVSGMSTAIAHSATIYGQTLAPTAADWNSYSTQSQTIAAENMYGALSTIAAGTWASDTSGNWLDETILPPDETYPIGIGTSGDGFKIENEFAVVTWSFSCT